MHHQRSFLAVSVINGDRSAPTVTAMPSLQLRQCRFDRFALFLFATGELAPQQAFLQALVVDTSPAALSTAPAITWKGKSLGRRSGQRRGRRQRKQRSGIARAAVAIRWRGAAWPRSIKPGWCPVAAAGRAGPRSAPEQASSRAGGRGWPSSAPAPV